jgi:hypothetical protein
MHTTALFNYNHHPMFSQPKLPLKRWLAQAGFVKTGRLPVCLLVNIKKM